MLKLLRKLRFWKSAETVDTAASLWDRFLPSARDVLAWAVTVLTSVGVGWWGAVQSALPFGIGLGIVMVVALRAAWLNEETRRVSGIGLAHPDRATLAGPGRGAKAPRSPHFLRIPKRGRRKPRRPTGRTPRLPPRRRWLRSDWRARWPSKCRSS
jgi:hypothetical protein